MGECPLHVLLSCCPTKFALTLPTWSWLFGKEVVLWDPGDATMEASELFHFPHASN